MLIRQILLFFSMLFLSLVAEADSRNTLPSNHKLSYAHEISFYICCSISFIVFAALLIALIRLRQSKPDHFHRGLGIELFWTIIPLVMIVILMVPAVMNFVGI